METLVYTLDKVDQINYTYSNEPQFSIIKISLF